MRARLQNLAGLFAALLMTALFSVSATAQDKGTIYYLAPTLFDEFQVETKDMVELLFGQLGYKVVTLDAQQRADLQNSQMDDTVLQKPRRSSWRRSISTPSRPASRRHMPPEFRSSSMTGRSATGRSNSPRSPVPS